MRWVEKGGSMRERDVIAEEVRTGLTVLRELSARLLLRACDWETDSIVDFFLPKRNTSDPMLRSR